MRNLIRFAATTPCPICNGFDGAPRGLGVRCFGFLSDDGTWAHCTREEFAGDLTVNAASSTYAHRLHGACDCGRTHGTAATMPDGMTRYEIKSANGETVAVHVRRDSSDGSKQLWWERPDSIKGLGGMKRDALPLYGIHRLRDTDGAVVLVEGEKTADALNAKGILAVATVTGAGGTPTDETLKPLSGRPVYLWADYDDGGRAHMNRIGDGLHRIGAKPHAITWPGATQKGDDAVDFFARGGTAEGARELIRTAQAWTPPADDADSGAVLVRLSDVQPETVTWLWPGRIPLGKLSIIDGDPGLGKSLITVDLAARISKKLPMPDGAASDLDGPAGVVVLSAEDDPADTIRPRFDAAGGDPSRVVLLQAVRVAGDDDGKLARERSVTLADLPELEAAIKSVDAKLVIIDPFMAYVGGTETHRDSEIRGLLAPLTRLASETGAAILLVRHLRKSGAGNPLYAGGGSIGIIGAVRSGMIVAADPDDETGENRILAQTKSNLSRLPVSLSYRIEEINGVPSVAWGGESAHDSRTLLAAQGEENDEREERSTLNQAVAFLRDLLKSGPVAVKEVQAAARAACIAPKTIRNAKTGLGVVAVREGFGKEGGWTWKLPKDALTPEGAPLASLVHSAIKRDSPKEALLDSMGAFGGETDPGKVEIDEDIPF